MKRLILCLLMTACSSSENNSSDQGHATSQFDPSCTYQRGRSAGEQAAGPTQILNIPLACRKNPAPEYIRGYRSSLQTTISQLRLGQRACSSDRSCQVKVACLNQECVQGGAACEFDRQCTLEGQCLGHSCHYQKP